MFTNDNNPEPQSLLSHTSDAHGQAALILVESLIHGLVERSVLTTHDALEIVGTARDVQADVAEAADGAGAKLWQSHSLLSTIWGSLKNDVEGDGDSPQA